MVWLRATLQEHVDRELPLDLRGLWQISPKELQIAINSEGRPVVLGRGAFGTVSFIETLSHDKSLCIIDLTSDTRLVLPS